MRYQNTYTDILTVIDRRIAEAVNNSIRFMWAVVEKAEDGFTVDVKLTTESTSVLPITAVPIVQNAYFSPVVQVGDTGLLININCNITNVLESKENVEPMANRDFYVFMPVNLKEQFQSAPESTTVLSADVKNKIELTNESLSTYHEADIILEAKKTYSITATEGMSITTKELTATVDEAVSIEAKELSASLQGEASIEAQGLKVQAQADVSIKGGTPIEVGCNAGTLKACFDAVFQAMDALSTGLTGPTSNPAAYTAAKPMAQAQIQMIVK